MTLERPEALKMEVSMVKVTTEGQRPLEYPDKFEYQQMKAIMHRQQTHAKFSSNCHLQVLWVNSSYVYIIILMILW